MMRALRDQMGVLGKMGSRSSHPGIMLIKDPMGIVLMIGNPCSTIPRIPSMLT